jgi:hypothetical protein
MMMEAGAAHPFEPMVKVMRNKVVRFVFLQVSTQKSMGWGVQHCSGLGGRNGQAGSESLGYGHGEERATGACLETLNFIISKFDESVQRMDICPGQVLVKLHRVS